MRRLERLWPALEAIPGPSAVAVLWRELLGPEYDLAHSLLRPVTRLAASYPRLAPLGRALPYRVVEHGPDDYVGVCPESGETISLTRGELIVYELDRSKLACWLAAAFGFRQSLTPDGLPPGTDLIGDYEPCAGYSFPAYLTIPLEARSLTRTVCGLASACKRPFLLLAPTSRRLRAESQGILDLRRACFLPLSDAIAVQESGKWVTTDSVAQALRDLREAHVPATEKAGAGEFFPTPAGARWSDLRLRFVDGHTIAVAVGEVTRVLHYSQIGMADGRNARPTRQWELLRAFAQGYGTLTWKSRDADRRNQKRREYLARDLKAFFRIDGEPIVLTDDGKGWRTVFRIEADG